MTDPARPPDEMELASLGRLAALPAAFLAGRELDLLTPLRFLPPGELPSGAPPEVDRAGLAAGLAAANRAYGHPSAAELAAKLARRETRVIATGQQPGLFGGPLLSFAKAVAACRWAAALEAAGQPAVAVFWMATEDHDWTEVARAAVPTPDGARHFDLGPDPEPLVPVGARGLGPGVEAALAELASLPGGPGYAAFWREVGAWYRPSSRFGEAFPRLFCRILGERAPLFLDALLPELKAAERPWLARFVERRAEVGAALAAAEARILERGFRLQVASQPGASPLFLLDGGERRRIEWHGDAGFTLRGSAAPPRAVADLLAILDDNPLIASPGALARPAIQDAVLGTTLQVMGAGELSYLAQAAALYPVVEAPAPWTSLRPQALVLEERHLGWLAELGVTLPQILGDPAALDRALAARRGPDPTAALREKLGPELDRLREHALALDKSLATPFEKTREQIERGLATFADKLAGAAARADETAAKRLAQLCALVLPEGQLQERVYATAHFPARYGERFAEAYWQQLDLDPRRLQVVRV